MSKRRMFARSILFAAAAAVAWPPWALLLGPLVGFASARALYLVAVTTAWAMAIAPSRAHRLPLAALVGAAALAVALLSHGSAALALGLAAIIGLTRGAFLYRGAAARALLGEMLLLGGGLLFARFLAGPGLFSLSLALWGFLLVQSVFFLFGGERNAEERAARGDPFDEAYRRAIALIEG